MSVIPIIASIHDLESAIRHGGRNPGARWYIAKRAAALGVADVVPSDWAVVAAGLPDFLKKDDGSEDGDGEKAKCSQKDCEKDAVMFGKCKEHAKKKSVTASARERLTRRQAGGKIGSMTAAATWDEELYLRDRNGRFIEKLDIVDVFPSGLAAPGGHFRGIAVGNKKGEMGEDLIIVKPDKDVQVAGHTIKAGTEIPVNTDDIESAPNPKARLDNKPLTPPAYSTPTGVKTEVNTPVSPKAIEAEEARYAKNVAAKDKLKEGGAARAKAEENLPAHRARIDAMYEKAGIANPNKPADLSAVPDEAPGGDDLVNADGTATDKNKMMVLGVGADEYDKIVAELETEERVSPEAIYAEAVIDRLEGDLDDHEDFVDDSISSAWSNTHPPTVQDLALRIDEGLPSTSDDDVDEDFKGPGFQDDLDAITEGMDKPTTDDEWNEIVDKMEQRGHGREATREALSEWAEPEGSSSDDAEGSLEGDPDHDADAAQAFGPDDDNPMDELRATGPDGELPPEYLESMNDIRDLLDVDSGLGSWASGLNDHTMTQLANSIEDYYDAPDSLDSYSRDKAEGLIQAAETMGIDDPTDLVEARRSFMNLGWAQQEQLQGVLNGEPLGSFNPSALRNIADVLHSLPGPIRNYGDDHSFEELSDAIHHYLDNPGPDPDAKNAADMEQMGLVDAMVEGFTKGDSGIKQGFDSWALQVLQEDPENGVDLIGKWVGLATKRHSERTKDKGWAAGSPVEAEAAGRKKLEDYGTFGGKDRLALFPIGDPREYSWGGYEVWHTNEDGTRNGGRGDFPDRASAQAFIDGYNEEYDKRTAPSTPSPTDSLTTQQLSDYHDLIDEGVPESEALESVTSEPDVPTPPGDPEPVQVKASQAEALNKLLLMSRSAEKDAVPFSATEADARLREIVGRAEAGGSSADEAHKDLARLMTELKLGGKQRKRYRELLDEHLGATDDSSAETSAAAVAEALRDDNPVKEKLAAKSGFSLLDSYKEGVTQTTPTVLPQALQAPDAAPAPAKKAAVSKQDLRDQVNAKKSDAQLIAEFDQELAEDDYDPETNSGDSSIGALGIAEWRKESMLRDLRAGEQYIHVKGETDHSVNRWQALAMLRAIGVDVSGISGKA